MYLFIPDTWKKFPVPIQYALVKKRISRSGSEERFTCPVHGGTPPESSRSDDNTYGKGWSPSTCEIMGKEDFIYLEEVCQRENYA